MNTLDFVRGQTVVSKAGAATKNWFFFRITNRSESRITLKPMTAVEVDGIWVPGQIDASKKTIKRLILGTSGQERIHGLIVDGLAISLVIYRKPRGGRRTGSGRKSGGGKGRTAITRSISMQPESWERFDRLQEGMSRGGFLSKVLKDRE